MRRLGLVAIVTWMALSVTTPVLAQHRHTAEDAGIRSTNGDISTSVMFVNRRPSKVKIYWLDYNGQRKFYKSLNAGEGYPQQTYLTHPWLITDIEGNSLAVFFPDAQPRTVEIW
jgi:von Hippel-Lindau disease tumor supressor